MIPIAQSTQCHERLSSQQKTLRHWERAGHNDVYALYGAEWFSAVAGLIAQASEFSNPFPAGALVESHSLSTAALNGLRGRILGPQGERYRVELPAPHGEKALKPTNLTVIELEVPLEPLPEEAFPIGALVEAHSLSSNTFNGLRGHVKGPSGDRISVEFPEPHGVKGIKP